ncbi:MAG: DUF1259 domain-containing protein [Gemmatimonadaceae bacterium]
MQLDRNRSASVTRGLCSLAALAGVATLAATLGACAREDVDAQQQHNAATTQKSQPQPQSQPVDWKQVDQAMGRTGSVQPGGVYKYSIPRSDLHITLQGVAIKPALALGSWVAFKPGGNGAMAMGDLVLTEDEVNPVMLKLRDGGVGQTAVHNHLLNESPKVMYMHIMAQGDAIKIGSAIRAALALSKTPMQASATPSAGDQGDASGAGGSAKTAASIDIDTATISRTLGHAGKVSSGVYQVSVPRAETVHDGGMEVPPSMGVATGMNFQPTGGGKAAITGDFVLLASEVNPVIEALRSNGIQVEALHTHMLTEQPKLYFMHFWANDDAVKLARGLRAALDRMNTKKATS